nr:MAG TPA: hypothetical protein [Caudoviricetes sp.]
MPFKKHLPFTLLYHVFILFLLNKILIGFNLKLRK